MKTPYFYSWTKQAGFSPFEVELGEHDEFVQPNGKRVYDFTSTSFQTSFGHSNRLIIDAITRQLGQMPIASPKAAFPLKTEVSQKLLGLLGFNDGKVFYTVSGAESVENALKMARRITGKPVILARKRSYHGASLGAMSVSGDWRSDEHLNFTQGTERIPEPDKDPDASGVREVVKRVGAERIAAVIVEPISGTNGVVIPPEGWFQGLRRVCDEFGILLICDEVLCGFHRCGSAFAFQGFQVRPDMVCMSKAISGGYIPFGAVWVNSEMARFYDEQVLVGGLTNFAHPLGLAALSGVLSQISEPSFRENLNLLEQTFSAKIQELAARRAATAVRVRGMLAAIEFGERVLPTWHQFVQEGLYVYTKGSMLILAPPLISTTARLRAAFDQLEQGLQVHHF
jgi:taurine---2-oxoglutarate transaminase